MLTTPEFDPADAQRDAKGAFERPLRRYIEVTVVSANAPESRKRGCIMPRDERASQLVDWCNRVGADVVVVQESGDYLKDEVHDHRPRWRASYPPANDEVRGRKIGTGQISRRWLTLADAARIECPKPGRRKPDTLNLPVRLYRYRTAGGWAEFVVIGYHAPTRRADLTGRHRRAMAAKVKAYSEVLHRLGVPHAVVGDANNGKKSWARQFPHLRVGAVHGVDWILVSDEIRVRETSHVLKRGLSDHHFLLAVLAIPVNDDRRLQRLP